MESGEFRLRTCRPGPNGSLVVDQGKGILYTSQGTAARTNTRQAEICMLSFREGLQTGHDIGMIRGHIPRFADVLAQMKELRAGSPLALADGTVRQG